MDQQPPPATPYPGGPPPPGAGSASPALLGPGITLIVAGAIGLLFGLYELVSFATVDPKELLDFMERSGQQLPPFLRRAFEDPRNQSTAGYVVWPILLVIDSLLVVAGGIAMVSGKAFPLAIAGAIAACIPCFGPCCCLGIPFGIWGLVVAFKPEVKATFR